MTVIKLFHKYSNLSRKGHETVSITTIIQDLYDIIKSRPVKAIINPRRKKVKNG